MAIGSAAAVNSVTMKFPLRKRPGPPVGKPLLGSLATLKKNPVIGAAEFA